MPNAPLSFGRATATLFVGLLVCSACSTKHTPKRTEPLEVFFAGCTQVVDTPEVPTCLVRPEGTLRLWIPIAPDAEVTIRDGSRHWRLDNESRSEHTLPYDDVDDGRRVTLQTVTGPRLDVATRRNGIRRHWRLKLGAAPAPAFFDRVRKLLTQPSTVDTAEALLEQRSAHDPSVFVQAEALGLLAQIDIAKGMPERAAERSREALALCRGHGITSAAIDIGTRLVHTYGRTDPVTARNVLDALPPPVGGDARAHYLVAHYRGTQAGDMADTRTAMRALTEASQIARRLAMATERLHSDQMLLLEWSRLGRFDQVDSLAAELLRNADLLGTCRQAQLFNNIGWNRLLAWEARGSAPGGTIVDQTWALFDRARRSYSGCGENDQAHGLRHTALNEALLALLAGRPRHAREIVSRLGKPHAGSPWQRIWSLDIEARIALAERAPQRALDAYLQLEELATTLLSLDARWRALVGQSRALIQLGERAAAREALIAAEALLDDFRVHVPIDAEPGTTLATRETSTRALLTLLLDDGDAARALAVARESRRRVLRGLERDTRVASLDDETRARWTAIQHDIERRQENLRTSLALAWAAPARTRAYEDTRIRREQDALRSLIDQAFSLLDTHDDVAPLPAPAPGETILLYHPIEEGWVGFAADRDTVRTARIGELDVATTAPVALAEQLLRPFAESLAQARSIRILSYGPLRTVDFHSLPLDGAPLVALAPVVYGLDLPAADVRSPAGRHRRGLVVADPTGTLADAPAEASAVARRLRTDGWQVALLREPSADTLADALADVALFHFAGHANLAGTGWRSELRLAAGSRLRVDEILTLPTVPRIVVLSACASSRDDEGGQAPGLGLAQAFLLAGAELVVGTVRPIDDHLAMSMTRVLYDELATGDSWPNALRRTQLAWRAAHPDQPWDAFRVIAR